MASMTRVGKRYGWLTIGGSWQQEPLLIREQAFGLLASKVSQTSKSGAVRDLGFQMGRVKEELRGEQIKFSSTY